MSTHNTNLLFYYWYDKYKGRELSQPAASQASNPPYLYCETVLLFYLRVKLSREDDSCRMSSIMHLTIYRLAPLWSRTGETTLFSWMQ